MTTAGMALSEQYFVSVFWMYRLENLVIAAVAFSSAMARSSSVMFSSFRLRMVSALVLVLVLVLNVCVCVCDDDGVVRVVDLFILFDDASWVAIELGANA